MAALEVGSGPTAVRQPTQVAQVTGAGTGAGGGWGAARSDEPIYGKAKVVWNGRTLKQLLLALVN